MSVTSIGNRLTPSSPIEITFGAQPIATGRKYTTLFGHMSLVPGTGIDYQVYTVINVGDYVAARKEVEVLAGVGSQISLMAEAFVKANTLVSGARNFPAFRVVLLPSAELFFGPANEAIEAVKFLRNDMLVSCYPTGDATNRNTILGLAQLMSGIDRDLQGQFGSFACLASIDALATQLAYAINKREIIAIALPDTNTALITGVTANRLSGSNKLLAVSSVAGIYKGAVISGTGIPAGTVVDSFDGVSITMSQNASSTATSMSLSIQNVVSQAPEIIASACSAVMMQSAFPYNPLMGMAIGGIVPPKKSSDKIVIDPAGSSEASLVAGLCPLYTQPGDSVAFIRSRTTYNVLPDNTTTVTSYFDWQDIAVIYDFREVCYQVTQNPPFNNNPGGTKASKQVASLLKDEILRNAQNFEDLGAFQGVQYLAKEFIVENSTTSRGRFDFKIPVNVVPGLYVIAGNIQAVSGLSDFQL